MFRLLAALTSNLGLACLAQAQGNAVDLHIAGAHSSEAFSIAVTNSGQVRLSGVVTEPQFTFGNPGFWNASTASFTSVMPAGHQSGSLLGSDAQSQVGIMFASGSGFAGLWYGTPQSYVNLHPQGWHSSRARAVSGGMQVGYFSAGPLAGGPRAALWRGSAASMVDLHPPGQLWSEALATDGELQGGRVADPAPGSIYAALWNGTAESFINMDPPGSGGSEILGMAPGVQVGFAYYPGMLNRRATVWMGTPESAVNVNPPGSVWSELFGTTGTAHVGVAYFGGFASAALWPDTSPDNVIDLHTLLPPGYGPGRATGIVEHDGMYYISGFASWSSREHAMLWIVPIPAPASALVLVAALFMQRRRRAG